jgi:hypothetical protein
MTSYPEIAHNLFMYEIRDTSDPIIAPRIESKTNEISKFLEKNNIICNDQYAITYISDVSELGYMMLPKIKIKNNTPIDLNIDTCLYSFELSINGYTSQGIYPYSENNNSTNSTGLISIKQIGVDNIIYIFDKTKFIGVKVNEITVNNM